MLILLWADIPREEAAAGARSIRCIKLHVVHVGGVLLNWHVRSRAKWTANIPLTWLKAMPLMVPGIQM